jgi:ankyrin repeat protein
VHKDGENLDRPDAIPETGRVKTFDNWAMTIGKAALKKKMSAFSFLLALVLCIMAGGCKSKEDYREEIEQRGMTYSADSFLDEVEADNKERVDLFIKAGMNINVRDKDGNTALMLASMTGDPKIVNLLIGKGADINARSTAGYTALMYVSSKGDTAMAGLLIKKGTDVNIRNNDGDTALMLASLNGNFEAAKLLVESGADVNVRNNKGNTALKYSFLDSRLEQLLRKAGARE